MRGFLDCMGNVVGVKELERRYVPIGEAELRASAGGFRTFSGYASVFNVWADIGGAFREQVVPGAFKKTVREGDIRMLIDHEGTPIARSKRGEGTLRLAEDSQGLAVEAQLDEKNPRVQELASVMDRGDMDGMSIGFWTIADDMDFEPADGGIPERSLREVSLNDGDVSPVTYPAFAQTSAQMRSRARWVLEAHGVSTDELDYEAALRAITTSVPQNWDGDPAQVRAAMETLEHLMTRATPTTPSEPVTSVDLEAVRRRQANAKARLALIA